MGHRGPSPGTVVHRRALNCPGFGGTSGVGASRVPADGKQCGGRLMLLGAAAAGNPARNLRGGSPEALVRWRRWPARIFDTQCASLTRPLAAGYFGPGHWPD